jgi:ribosomal subunit interface protein
MRMKILQQGIQVSDALRAYVEARLLFALGRFGPSATLVRIGLCNTAGPDGSRAVCGIAFSIPAGIVLVRAGGETVFEAIDQATDRLGRAVRARLAA